MSQLYEDLKSIRVEKNLAVEDIFDKTRISKDNIELIEDGSLLAAGSNRTYVRSFIRTYSKAVGISEADILKALELHEKGDYDGYLAASYLKEKPKAVQGRQGDKTKKQDEVKPDDEETDKPSKAKPIITPAALDVKETEKKDIYARAHPRVLPYKEDSAVNWGEMNKRAGKKKMPMGAVVVLLIVFILLAAIAGGAYYFYFVQPTDPQPTTDQDTTEEVSEIDFLDAPIAPDPSQAAAIILPDTLTIVVYAAYGNLEPFRVSSDTFLNRRPYWLERGRGMRITFIDEINLYNQLDRMLVMYEGRVFTQFAERDDAEARITIRREQFINDPSLESFTSASLPQGVSVPNRIIDRPVIIE